MGRRDFQYSIRADQIERVDGAERRSLAELHDRELEDFLLVLVEQIRSLEDRVTALEP